MEYSYIQHEESCQEMTRAKNQSFDSFLASFELLRIAVSSGSCESVESALCEEKKASVP